MLQEDKSRHLLTPTLVEHRELIPESQLRPRKPGLGKETDVYLITLYN
jgi:hypothetical protein